MIGPRQSYHSRPSRGKAILGKCIIPISRLPVDSPYEVKAGMRQPIIRVGHWHATVRHPADRLLKRLPLKGGAQHGNRTGHMGCGLGGAAYSNSGRGNQCAWRQYCQIVAAVRKTGDLIRGCAGISTSPSC
jgi:hypothetical protein